MVKSALQKTKMGANVVLCWWWVLLYKKWIHQEQAVESAKFMRKEKAGAGQANKARINAHTTAERLVGIRSAAPLKTGLTAE